MKGPERLTCGENGAPPPMEKTAVSEQQQNSWPSTLLGVCFDGAPKVMKARSHAPGLRDIVRSQRTTKDYPEKLLVSHQKEQQLRWPNSHELPDSRESRDRAPHPPPLALRSRPPFTGVSRGRAGKCPTECFLSAFGPLSWSAPKSAF